MRSGATAVGGGGVGGGLPQRRRQKSEACPGIPVSAFSRHRMARSDEFEALATLQRAAQCSLLAPHQLKLCAACRL